MTEKNHTPLPWKVGHRATSIGCENQKIGGYASLFDVRGWGYFTGQGHGGLGLSQDEACAIQEANAEFVVRACNSHYDLLEAASQACHDLSAVRRFAEWCHDSPASLAGHIAEGLTSIIDSINKLAAAIAKAEGKA